MQSNSSLAVDWSTIPRLQPNHQILERAVNSLLASSLPDAPRKSRVWVDDLPEFEGDEGLRHGAVWSKEYLQEFARAERARRQRVTTEFAEFVGNQFAVEFIKTMNLS